MKTVIFACVHNAGRSQIAAAWLNKLADSRTTRALSAGTDPGTRVHPEVLEVMREVGIHLSAAPQLLTSAMLDGATHLITMGCGDACPVAPAHVQRSDWPLQDPKGLHIGEVRAIRDEIRTRVEALLQTF
jgi:arsenate reductase